MASTDDAAQSIVSHAEASITEDAVTADASDKRAAAQTKREDAADKRTTADRVEGLAHAEKQGRRDAAR